MPPILLQTAEPFLFPGNETACLLLHGFTASPQEMRGMGQFLRDEHGYTVLGIRIAGHGTTPQDMRHMHWEDWLASAEDGWHLLQSAGWTRIVPVGLSMGGVLALLMASYLPVRGVVAMATPYALPVKIPKALLRILRVVRPYYPKAEGPVYDPKGFEGRIAYPVYPTQSVIELGKMLAVMRASLSRITAPVMLIHSKNDDFVPSQHSEQIFAALGSKHKELKFVERSTHVLTQDAERARVFSLAAEFISQLASAGGGEAA